MGVTMERIKKAIKESGWKQKAIAEKIDMTAQQMSHAVNGRGEISVEAIVPLCKVLQTDPNTLLGYEEAK